MANWLLCDLVLRFPSIFSDNPLQCLGSKMLCQTTWNILRNLFVELSVMYSMSWYRTFLLKSFLEWLRSLMSFCTRLQLTILFRLWILFPKPDFCSSSTNFVKGRHWWIWDLRSARGTAVSFPPFCNARHVIHEEHQHGPRILPVTTCVLMCLMKLPSWYDRVGVNVLNNALWSIYALLIEETIQKHKCNTNMMWRRIDSYLWLGLLLPQVFAYHHKGPRSKLPFFVQDSMIFSGGECMVGWPFFFTDIFSANFWEDMVVLIPSLMGYACSFFQARGKFLECQISSICVGKKWLMEKKTSSKMWLPGYLNVENSGVWCRCRKYDWLNFPASFFGCFWIFFGGTSVQLARPFWFFGWDLSWSWYRKLFSEMSDVQLV